MNFPLLSADYTGCHKARMNGTHGNGCNSLSLARHLAESHNVPVIEVELLKRPDTKSWKFSDKHEKRSCIEKHRGTPGSSQAKRPTLSIVVIIASIFVSLYLLLLCDNLLIQFTNLPYSMANSCHTFCHRPNRECKTLIVSHYKNKKHKGTIPTLF